jgi:ribose transport system permease protein
VPESRTAAVLVVLVVVFAILKPNFTSSGNITTIVTISAILGIVTLGQTVVLISGGFDLSVGGVVPLSGVVFALLTRAHHSFLVSLVLTVLLGIAVGVVNAVVIGRFRVNALIATLGMLSITGGLAYILARGQTLSVPDDAGVLGNPSSLWDLPNFVWLTLLLAVAVDVLLRFTVPGRLIYSVGGNTEACRVAGVRVEGVRVLAYAISGAFAAVAGICFASQLLAAQGAIGSSSTLDSLTAAVLGGAALIGGIGSAPGAILGVLIIGSIQDGLTLLKVQSFYEQIAAGAVLIIAVALTSLRSRRG